MALNNCNIETPLVLDSYVAGATNITTAITYIYPDEGYNISASAFSHPTTLNNAIASITYADMGIAGADDNYVKVSIDFYDNYTTLGYDTTLSMYIEGDAVDSSLIQIVAGLLESAEYVSMLTAPITVTAETGITHNFQALVPSGNGHIHYFSGVISSDTPTKLAVLTISVDNTFATTTQSPHLPPSYLSVATQGGFLASNNIGLDKFNLVNVPSSTVTDAFGNTSTLVYELWYEDNINTPFPTIVNSNTGVCLSDHTATLQIDVTLPLPGTPNDDEDITGVEIIPNDGGVIIPQDGIIEVFVTGNGGDVFPATSTSWYNSWQDYQENFSWLNLGGTIELEDEGGNTVYTEPIVYEPNSLELPSGYEPQPETTYGVFTGGKATIGGFTDLTPGSASVNWTIKVIPNSGETISAFAGGGTATLNADGSLSIPFKQVYKPRITITPTSHSGMTVSGTISTQGAANAEAEAVLPSKNNFVVQQFSFTVESSTGDLVTDKAGATVSQSSFTNSGFIDTPTLKDAGYFQVGNVTSTISSSNAAIGIVTGTIYINKYSDVDIESVLDMDDYFELEVTPS